MEGGGGPGEASSLLDWVTDLARDPALRTRFAEEPRSVLDEQGLSGLPPADLHHSLPLVTDSVAARLGTDVAVPSVVGASAQLAGEDPVEALVRQFGAVADTVLAATEFAPPEDSDDGPSDPPDPADLDGMGEIDDAGGVDDPSSDATDHADHDHDHDHDTHDLDDLGDAHLPDHGPSPPWNAFGAAPLSSPDHEPADEPDGVFDGAHVGGTPDTSDDPDPDDADPDDAEATVAVETVPPEPEHDPPSSDDLEGEPDTGDPEPDLDLD